MIKGKHDSNNRCSKNSIRLSHQECEEASWHGSQAFEPTLELCLRLKPPDSDADAELVMFLGMITEMKILKLVLRIGSRHGRSVWLHPWTRVMVRNVWHGNKTTAGITDDQSEEVQVPCTGSQCRGRFPPRDACSHTGHQTTRSPSLLPHPPICELWVSCLSRVKLTFVISFIWMKN